MNDHNQFIQLNNFVQADNGVFYKDAAPKKFNYSDGPDVEKKLHDILSSVTDLSSQSEQLQAHIIDWPTEYHLSVARSNLLRAINLTGAKRILELGCGCGSITRYLGEQEDLLIDSVEGSPQRATLAALRCRDLENVTIANANFNDLQLPESHYDLVLFVGVTEYAGRFSKRDSDQQALQDLLTMSYRTTTPEGVTLVAIENRVGLKYLHGANEDHYSVPYIGLQNYPESQGIKTYTKAEWLEQIVKAKFIDSKFLYPFPDYKVPSVVIDDTVAGDADRIETLLQKVKSRDYATNFTLGDVEPILWSALASAGTLGEHANSFLILMAKQSGVLEQNLVVSEFQNHVAEPDYLVSSKPVDDQPSEVKHLSAQLRYKLGLKDVEINRLNDQLKQGQDYVSLLERSKGGRVLRFLRRCLGRGNDVKKN